MGSVRVRDDALGLTFALDERFADAGFPRDEELPTAHYVASEPREGRIAALAIVTVRAEPLPAEEWLAQQVARARASFAEWSPEAHEMLVAPEPASLAGRPAVHVRYRLLPAPAGDAEPPAGSGPAAAPPADSSPAAAPPAGSGPAADPLPDAGDVPASFVEHWTVLVEERRWLLAMELMVQPPAWWDDERDQLELPFRTLELL